jgi:hypothetical protein
LKKIGLLVLVALAAFFAIVALQPADFRLERSTEIAAPADVVFANLDDFRRWGPWSPWEKLDPGMAREYAGASAGMGATYHWTGNADVGEGRMTITESAPPERLAIRLEFIAPFAATNEAVFTLRPSADGDTEVSWAMTGKNDFMAKAAGMFMDMEAMVGGDFERGLAALKQVSEEQAAARAADEARRVQEAAAAAAASANAPAALPAE